MALCPVAGIRTALAWAQACHETAYFRFPGMAQASWNNPAGIGVTGAPDAGNRFASKEDGVRAHLGHLLWYFGWNHPVKGFCEYDPRHEGILGFGGHKKLENDIRQLDGRWAVPGRGVVNGVPWSYGTRLAHLALDLVR